MRVGDDAEGYDAHAADAFHEPAARTSKRPAPLPAQEQSRPVRPGGSAFEMAAGGSLQRDRHLIRAQNVRPVQARVLIGPIIKT
jgi:hypothetical protein